MKSQTILRFWDSLCVDTQQEKESEGDKWVGTSELSNFLHT